MGGSNVLNGLICFYKPRGIGSTNVVRYLQSVLNCHYYNFDLDAVNVPTSFKRTPTKVGTLARKVGHGGTLDPLAEGCLVLGVGDGTKILNKFLNCTKKYYATGKLGIETDTYDTEGKILKELSYSHVDQAKFDTALNKFRGEILQVPPKFSAKQIGGKRLYELARKQPELHIDIPAAQVNIHELTSEPLEFDKNGNLLPTFKLNMEVSKGTYVRSVIHDLGQELGCGAAMTNLVRTKQGPFTLDDCIQLEDAKNIEILKDKLDQSKEYIKKMQ